MIDFWKMVGEQPLETERDVAKAVEYVSERLDEASPMELVSFDDRLREYLFRLDRRAFARIPVSLPGANEVPQTSDHFLYARCACVLAGENAYGAVIRTGSGFDRYVHPELQSAEEVLYLAPGRYQARTGRPFRSRSEFSIDWMSNHRGWESP